MTSPFIFFAFGILGFVVGISLWRKNNRIRHWPETGAEIIKKEVEMANVKGVGVASRFEPKVEYRYTINGKNYTGSRLWAAQQTMQKKDAEKFLNELPQNVNIFYNPKNPQEAYLFKMSPLWAFAAIAIGIFSILIGIGSL